MTGTERPVVVHEPPADAPYPGAHLTRDPAGYWQLRDDSGWVFGVVIRTNGSQERFDATLRTVLGQERRDEPGAAR